MCGGGIKKIFKSVSKAVSSVFKSVGGILKSPVTAGLVGAGIGLLTGGLGAPVAMGGMGMLSGAGMGAALGVGASTAADMLSPQKMPEMPKIDINIPEAPVPAPAAIAPTGTGALVEVGAASDDLLKVGRKRGSGKRTTSSVAGLGSGGLRL